jgi:dihydroorotase-like cyclic amidohydrolase
LGSIVDGRIDVIATDHALYTLEEKQQLILNVPSGGQCNMLLVAMFEAFHQGKLVLRRS